LLDLFEELVEAGRAIFAHLRRLLGRLTYPPSGRPWTRPGGLLEDMLNQVVKRAIALFCRTVFASVSGAALVITSILFLPFSDMRRIV
jgi:hypothetical protein